MPADSVKNYSILTGGLPMTVWLSVTCIIIASTPGNAARTAAPSGHQPAENSVTAASSSLRHLPSSQSRHHRSTAASRHEQYSPAHHPQSPLAVSITYLERYVDEQLGKLETRFNQKLDEQSRKLNQSVAIGYIEKVLDYINEELQNSQELITAVGRNGGTTDQSDSAGTLANELSHEVDRQRGELARVKETLSELKYTVDHLANVLNGLLLASTAISTSSRMTTEIPESSIHASTQAFIYPTDCQDAFDKGLLLRADGFQYTLIQPQSTTEPFKACCYVNHTFSWTVIQRRLNGSVDFYRNWEEYKHGFGLPEAEFWLGNERIYQLTNQGDYRLRVEMVTWDDNPHWAEYQYFRLAPEYDRYRLHVSGFVPDSDAGDSLTSAWDNDHNSQPFSTYDSDNDARFYDNCAQHYRGAWWFRSCFQSHLNGVYYHRGSHSNFFVRNGIQWNTIHPHSSLRYVAMMVRRHSIKDSTTSNIRNSDVK